MLLPSSPRAVLFSDLDGTFLSQETYQPGPAAAALSRLAELDVLVVFCSAKTRAEQTHILAGLGHDAPFIVENGAAIATADSVIAEFGIGHDDVLSGLRQSAEEASVAVRGYDDMTLVEISALTGLSPDAAARARARDYSVTFQLEEGSAEDLRDALSARGLRMIRGAVFWSAQGEHDKGDAVRSLTRRLRAKDPGLVSYGVGDYANDVEMLAAVDTPMLVQRPGGEWAEVAVDALVRLPGVGPDGWVLAAGIIEEEVGV